MGKMETPSPSPPLLPGPNGTKIMPVSRGLKRGNKNDYISTYVSLCIREEIGVSKIKNCWLKMVGNQRNIIYQTHSNQILDCNSEKGVHVRSNLCFFLSVKGI